MTPVSCFFFMMMMMMMMHGDDDDDSDNTNDEDNLTKKKRCPHSPTNCSTPLTVFSLLHLAMENMATKITTGPAQNLEQANRMSHVRRGSLGVESWTCDPVWGKGSIYTPGVYSAAIPLGEGFTVHYLVFSDRTYNRRSCVCAHITLHTRKIPSYSSKKAPVADDGCQCTNT